MKIRDAVPPLFPFPKGRYRVVFQVEIENRTGKIFWLNRKEADANEKVNLYAERLVQNLQFEPLQKAFVTYGEVEIIVSTEELI